MTLLLKFSFCTQNSDGYQKELPSQNWGTHEQEVIVDGGGDHI